MCILISVLILQVPEELRRLREVLALENKPCALRDPAGETSKRTVVQKGTTSNVWPGTPQCSESHVCWARDDHAGMTSPSQSWEACGAIDLHTQISAEASSAIKQYNQDAASEALASVEVRLPCLVSQVYCAGKAHT